MIGQTISHYKLTLWSLSKIREGRNGTPSLRLEKGPGDEFCVGTRT